MRKLNDNAKQMYYELQKEVRELSIDQNPIEIFWLDHFVGVIDFQPKINIELYGLGDFITSTIEENIDVFNVSSFLSLIPFCDKAIVVILNDDGGDHKSYSINTVNKPNRI